MKGLKSKRATSGKVGNLQSKIQKLQKENRAYKDEIHNKHQEAEQLKELYTDEREKNEDLIKHLNNSRDSGQPQNRKPSARPKSASKYGRNSDSPNMSSQDVLQDDGADENIAIDDGDQTPVQSLPALSFSEVEILAYEVRMRFQKEGLPFEDIDSLSEDQTQSLLNFKLFLMQQLSLPE